MIRRAEPVAREEVDGVARPARARVHDAVHPAAVGPEVAGPEVGPEGVEPDTTGARAGFQRRRDYLDGFLHAAPPALGTHEPGGALHEAVVEALKEIFDPEIPVNIYDLGLIYDVIVEEGHVTVRMTLTTPHCPVAESMPAEVELRVAAVPGVGVVTVDLVWDPPWNPSKMTDEARLELGML